MPPTVRRAALGWDVQPQRGWEGGGREGAWGHGAPDRPRAPRHKRWWRLLVMLTIEAEPRKQRVARQEPGYERTALAQCWIAKTQRPQARKDSLGLGVLAPLRFMRLCQTGFWHGICAILSSGLSDCRGGMRWTQRCPRKSICKPGTSFRRTGRLALKEAVPECRIARCRPYSDTCWSLAFAGRTYRERSIAPDARLIGDCNIGRSSALLAACTNCSSTPCGVLANTRPTRLSWTAFTSVRTGVGN